MKPIEKEFSQGVKILLERMQNNPEDFVTGYDSHNKPKFSMFSDLMRDVLRGDRVIKQWDDWYLFTKAEQSALIQGYKDMMRARFDQGVMRKLLEDPNEPVIKPEYFGKSITASAITNHALRVLEDKFAKTPTKLMINPSQIALANKLGISTEEYARRLSQI
jgi:hypothetical protein